MYTSVLNKNSKDYLQENTGHYLCKWNYTTCAAPVVQYAGLGDGNGVLVAGQPLGIIFPGPNGEMYPSTMHIVTACTTTVMIPQIEGAIPLTDAGATAVGYNVQLDGETTDNSGMQWSPGSGVQGSNANKFTVGTHTGHIDVTFWTQDWTDYDCVVVGFRKEEAFQAGHNAILAAGSADDGVYTDFCAIGAMTDTDIRTMTDLNNSGTSTVTDVDVVPVDNDNMRVRIKLNSGGTVSYGHVNDAEAGAGTLAEPGSAAAYTFDDGDTLIPYIATFKNSAADVEILIKDIEIYREPSIDYATQV